MLVPIPCFSTPNGTVTWVWAKRPGTAGLGEAVGLGTAGLGEAVGLDANRLK